MTYICIRIFLEISLEIKNCNFKINYYIALIFFKKKSLESPLQLSASGKCSLLKNQLQMKPKAAVKYIKFCKKFIRLISFLWKVRSRNTVEIKLFSDHSILTQLPLIGGYAAQEKCQLGKVTIGVYRDPTDQVTKISKVSQRHKKVKYHLIFCTINV